MRTSNYLFPTSINSKTGYYNFCYNTDNYLVSIIANSVDYDKTTGKEEFRWFIDIVKINGNHVGSKDYFYRFATLDNEEMSCFSSKKEAIDLLEKNALLMNLKTIKFE